MGLNLSRAQVRKLVQKVVTRDSLHYRKLTDKAKDDNGKDEKDVDKSDNGKTQNEEELLRSLALGKCDNLPRNISKISQFLNNKKKNFFVFRK